MARIPHPSEIRSRPEPSDDALRAEIARAVAGLTTENARVSLDFGDAKTGHRANDLATRAGWYVETSRSGGRYLTISRPSSEFGSFGPMPWDDDPF